MKKIAASWYEKPLARIGTAVVMVLLAFLLATYAIDSANLFAYGATLVLVIFSLRFAYLAIKRR